MIMFDITGITTSISIFGTARNAREDVTVEYVEDNRNKSKHFDTYEEAERWVKQKGLRKGDPHGSGSEKEYRFVQ